MAADIIIDDPYLRKLAGKVAVKLKSIATDLDKHTKNTNIARVAGGIIGATGTIISGIGFITIPLTAGASSLVVGIGAGITGAAGGVTAAGAKITHMFIEKSKMKDAQEVWSTFMEGLEKALNTKPELMQSVRDVLVENLTRLGLSTTSVAGNVGAAVVRGSRATTQIAGAGARVAATTIAGAVALNGVLLGLSMYDIIDGSLELNREKKSKAGDTLRQFAMSLETFAETGRFE